MRYIFFCICFFPRQCILEITISVYNRLTQDVLTWIWKTQCGIWLGQINHPTSKAVNFLGPLYHFGTHPHYLASCRSSRSIPEKKHHLLLKGYLKKFPGSLTQWWQYDKLPGSPAYLFITTSIIILSQHVLLREPEPTHQVTKCRHVIQFWPMQCKVKLGGRSGSQEACLCS